MKTFFQINPSILPRLGQMDPQVEMDTYVILFDNSNFDARNWLQYLHKLLPRF